MESRKGQVQRCSICGETGHNRASHEGYEIKFKKRVYHCSICGSDRHIAGWHRFLDMKEQKCKGCGLVLPIDMFQKVIKHSRPWRDEYLYYVPYCFNCATKISVKQRKERKSKLDTFISYSITDARIRARNKNIAFDLDASFIKDIYEKQNGKCYYTGEQLTTSGSTLISIDRIDSQLGYTRDNVVLCTKAINYSKQSHSIDSFINLCGLVWKLHGNDYVSNETNVKESEEINGNISSDSH